MIEMNNRQQLEEWVGKTLSELKYPTLAFIDGQFVPAVSGEVFETIDPATEKVIAEIASCGEQDVDVAVAAARRSFDDGVWSRSAPHQRKSILLELVRLIDRDKEEIALLESLESGKPISECMALDVPESLHCLSWFAEGVDKVYGETSPTGLDAVSMIVREPMPVVGCVIPWNYPLLTLAWKIAPALAVGSSILVKPSEHTSFSALKIADLAREAGVPAGVLNVLPGYGQNVGRAIGMHNGIDAVSFTGSTKTGRKFLEYSAQSNLKQVTLECGGKSPCIVLQDANDMPAIARHAIVGAFLNSGQNCTANSRLIVHESVKADLVPHLVSEAEKLITSDPLSMETKLGPLVSGQQRSRVIEFIEGAKSNGCELLFEGEVRADVGYFVPPTIFDGVTSGHEISREEVFGPVLAIMSVESDEAAIKLANDSEYGLQASIFTNDVKKVHKIARELSVGTVTVNCYGEGDVATPFGGFKLSGFGGRDKSKYAYDQYTQIKTIWINLDDE